MFLSELKTGRSFCWEVERGSRDSPSPDVTTAKHQAGPMEEGDRDSGSLILVRRGRGVVLMVNNRADMTAPRRTARAEAGYRPLMIPTQPTPITLSHSNILDGEVDAPLRFQLLLSLSNSPLSSSGSEMEPIDFPSMRTTDDRHQ